MQGMMGCYIKRNYNLSSSAKGILDKMLSILGTKNNVALDAERADFPNLSLSVLSHSQTPCAFKPIHFTANYKHIFIDGFVKKRQDFVDNVNENVSNLQLLRQYSGIYNIILFDETNNELRIANSRHGARYLYYYDDEDCFIFAPNPKFILSSGLVKNKHIDYQSIISLFSHEYIMGDRSLVQSIKLIPYASCIIVRNNFKEIKNYWNFDSLSLEKNSFSYSNLIEEGTILLKNAIESYAFENERIIIPLSGGLDSRTIACFLSDKTNCQAMHIDYGFEKKYAKKIAQTLKIDLEVFPLDTYQPWEAIDTHILCSSQSIHQFWIYQFLKKKIEQSAATLIIDGYLMNEVIGGLSTLKRDDYSNIERIYPPLNQAFGFLLGPKIRRDYYANHNSQVSEIINNCPSDINYDRYLYFTILNYGRRFTLLFSVIHQYLCSVGLPILDYELMDFCLRLPFDVKENSRFYRDIIISSFPQISPIPWSRNRLPLDSNKKEHIICSIQREIDQFKYYLTRMTNSKIETLPPHDKNRRFRKDKAYREYFMNIIFDEQTFDKGYVSKTGLEKLVGLIDSGRNYFDLLEKVALVELVSRELEVS